MLVAEQVVEYDDRHVFKWCVRVARLHWQTLSELFVTGRAQFKVAQCSAVFNDSDSGLGNTLLDIGPIGYCRTDPQGKELPVKRAQMHGKIPLIKIDQIKLK